MADTTSGEAAELCRQAMEQFEAAVKASAKIQEETLELFFDLWTDSRTPADWRQQAQAAVSRLIPVARTNLEEASRLVNKNASAALEMVEKALQAGSPTDVSAAARKCWDTMFTTMRDNAQALIDANARAVQAWKEMMGAFGSAVDQPADKQPE